MPARSTAEMCTNASGWPSSRLMKPKPFMALKNLTVPLAFSPVSCRCGPAGRAARSTGTAGRAAAIRHRDRLAVDLEIGRRDPAAAIDERELERLAFRQRGQARLLDRGDVNEHILAAVIADDEAEALLGVEEFDDAFAFADNLRRHAAAAATTAAEAAATTSAAAAETTAAAAVAAATTAEAITAAAESVAAAAAKTVAASEAAAITVALEIVVAETVALVSAAPAALTAAPFVETHAFQNFPSAQPCFTCRARAKARTERRENTTHRDST